MSSENIKTGLKLSEAIKLLEENDGALIKHDDEEHWSYVEDCIFHVRNQLYSVKLPPPKTVTVTKESLSKAFVHLNGHIKHMAYNSAFEQLCKELGL